MAKEQLFWIGIKGLIENKRGEVLLFKADTTKFRGATSAYWDIPGGRIQLGQTSLQALKREIAEETGIKEIQSVEFFTAVISNHKIPLDGSIIGLALMIYKVKIPVNSKITMSDEHTGVEWVDKKEAAKRLAYKYPPEFTTLLNK